MHVYGQLVASFDLDEEGKTDQDTHRAGQLLLKLVDKISGAGAWETTAKAAALPSPHRPRVPRPSVPGNCKRDGLLRRNSGKVGAHRV